MSEVGFRIVDTVVDIVPSTTDDLFSYPINLTAPSSLIISA